jgi:hypothetical protein
MVVAPFTHTVLMGFYSKDDKWLGRGCIGSLQVHPG